VIDKYESILAKTNETLVSVYSKMKPDAAAAQFAMLDDDVAIALLSRLSPKASSQILS
jgi:flagellar motility protein MotE (MotC chaperone)